MNIFYMQWISISLLFLSGLNLVFPRTIPTRGFWEMSAIDADGKSVPMETYRSAKVILIVNVASNCGYTYENYRELADLYDRLHDKGLEILAFPTNNFGRQEPGTDEEIQNFVKKNFGVTFPVFAKLPNIVTDEIYNYLRDRTNHVAIGWNFVKFLLVDGVPVRRYASNITPKEIEKDILIYLGETVPDEVMAVANKRKTYREEL